MKFAVVVHHDHGSAYGVTVPDLPGCLSAGDTFDAALDNTTEAIELHLENPELAYGTCGSNSRASKIPAR